MAHLRTVGSYKYWYATYRLNGEVRQRYLGRGPFAEALATSYAHRRDCAIERREQIQAECQQVAALERPIVEYCEGVDELFAAWMRLSGWHPHHGQWRTNGKITRRVIMSEGFDNIDDAKKAEEFAWWLTRSQL